MKKALSLTAILFVTSACTAPVGKETLAPLDTALQEVNVDVGGTVATEVRAEAQARRNAAIRDGKPPYRLLPGCAADDITLIGAPKNAQDAATFVCDFEEIDATTRAPTNAETTGKLLGLLSSYVAELDALTRSDLPEEVATAGVTLLTDAAGLASALGIETAKSPILGQPKSFGRLTRFALEQYRSRVLRQVVREARAPFEQAVRTIVSYLLETGKDRDPVVRSSARLLEADEQMQLNPGNEAVVAAFEADFAADRAARAISPAIRMMRVLAVHEALADRLQRPATAEELTALITELAELRRLLLPK